MPTNLIWMAAGLSIGVVIFFVFCAILAKLAAKYSTNEDDLEGDIYVDDEGEVYAQFNIPIEEIKKSKTVRLVVHHVKTKKG